MDTCIWTAESFGCSPETITTLLTGYSKQVVYRLFDFKDKEKNSIKKIEFES